MFKQLILSGLLTLLVTDCVLAGPLGELARSRSGARVGEQAQKMLGLSAKQVQMLQPILIESASQFCTIQDNNTLSQSEKKNLSTKLVLETVDQARPILNEKQRSELVELMQRVGQRLQAGR